MQITDIKITLSSEPRLKAYVQVVFDNCFTIRDLKIIEGTGGLFVAMPSRRMKDGTYRDVAHPLNQETRDLIEREIMRAYTRQPAAAASERAVVGVDGEGELLARSA